jgi:glyoxylate utilization-related uncharacterized protein
MQDKAAGDLPEKLENLCSHVRRLPLQEGLNETAVPYLKIYKQAAGEKDLPVCEHPLYVISGSLSLHGEEESRVLSEGDFFVPPHLSRAFCDSRRKPGIPRACINVFRRRNRVAASRNR